MSGATEPLQIDVVSDVVCPWCFVGKRRLEEALKRDPSQNVAIHWRPFQLDPTIPPGGLDRNTYLERKFGPGGIAKAHERLTALGAEAGIRFDFPAIQRSPNTFDAHRLIAWAHGVGAQDKIVERLFTLYFEEAQDIGDSGVLTKAAADCGMDAALVADLLLSDADKDRVEAEIEHIRGLGISGVPFYVFASKFGVSGAQDAGVLVEAMERARV